jgi:hypothetical protein
MTFEGLYTNKGTIFCKKKITTSVSGQFHKGSFEVRFGEKFSVNGCGGRFASSCCLPGLWQADGK